MALPQEIGRLAGERKDDDEHHRARDIARAADHSGEIGGLRADAVHEAAGHALLALVECGDEEGEARNDTIRSALRLQSEVPISRRSGDTFRVPLSEAEGSGVLRLSVVKEKDAGRVAFYDSDGNLYSLARFEPEPAQRVLGSRLALIPPLLAILLAFMVRNTLLSLFAGVLAGGLLLAQADGNPFSFLAFFSNLSVGFQLILNLGIEFH